MKKPPTPSPTPFRLLCGVLTVVTELLLQNSSSPHWDIQLWLSCRCLYLRTGLILPSLSCLCQLLSAVPKLELELGLQLHRFLYLSLSPTLSLSPSVSGVSLSRLVCMHFGPQTIGLVLLLLIVYASFVIRVHSPHPSPHSPVPLPFYYAGRPKILAYAK